jgi:uncharacterized protein (TIGR03000 family)
LYLGLGGLGYGGYGGGYSSGYTYAPSYYNAYPSADYGQVYSGGVQTQSAYPQAPAGTASQIIVRVPSNAKLWVDDYESQLTGPVRQLNTPATLEPGRTYRYTLKAQWIQNGQPVVQERVVSFQAGQSTEVDFARPQPATTAPAPVERPVITPAAPPLPPATPPATEPSPPPAPVTPPAAPPPPPVTPPATEPSTPPAPPAP